MNSHVKVRVRGEQSVTDRPGERSDPILTEAEGRYRFVSGRHHFSFEEMLEGTTAVTRNHVIVGTDSVEVRKSGPVTTSMVFENGRKHPMTYQTAFGQLSMEIRTKNLVIEEERNRMKITIRYSIRSAGQTVSENITVLEFQDA